MKFELRNIVGGIAGLVTLALFPIKPFLPLSIQEGVWPATAALWAGATAIILIYNWIYFGVFFPGAPARNEEVDKTVQDWRAQTQYTLYFVACLLLGTVLMDLLLTFALPVVGLSPSKKIEIAVAVWAGVPVGWLLARRFSNFVKPSSDRKPADG